MYNFNFPSLNLLLEREIVLSADLFKSSNSPEVSKMDAGKLAFMIGTDFLNMDDRDFSSFNSHDKFQELLEHVYKTASIGKYIAEIYKKENSKFSLNPDDVYNALIYHDLGKIGIDENILFKKGALTPFEFEVCRAHVLTGPHYLRQFGEYFDEVQINLIFDAMVFHHENYGTGDGYPLGLKGEEIPEIANIAKVADVTEVLLAKRSYKDKLGLQRTRDILKNGDSRTSPHHFHPEYLEIILEGLAREEGIFKAYNLNSVN